MGYLTPVKRVLLNALLALASLAVALAGVELLLNYVDPCDQPDAGKLFYEHDDLLGWRKIPNEEGVLVQPEYAVRKKINSKGLRGPEWPYEKPEPGLFRILFLGDSYCEGYAVELCDLFTERLQELLDSRRAGRYEVINGGTGGYSTDQELLFFQTEGYKYEPDLVILLFYYNDIVVNTQDSYWEHPKPLFKLEGDELCLTNVPVPMPGIREKSEELSLAEWLSRNSRIYSFFAEKLGQTAWFGSGDSSPPPMPPSYREFIVFQSSPSQDMQNAWMLTEALLHRLRDEVRSSRSEFAVLHVPFKATVYLEEFESLRQHHRIPAELCDADRPGKDLAAVCRRLSIPLIDPLDRLRKQAEVVRLQGKRLYFVLDDHWTAEGNESVARVLYDHIVTAASSGE